MLPRDYNANPSIANPDINVAGIQYEKNPGAAHGDHIKNTYAICNTSISHTFGNVLAVVEKYLVDIFSSQVEFRTVITNTSIASRQIRHLPNQLYKKEMPMMALVPRMSFGQDDNRFLGHTIMNDQVTDTHAIWGDGSLIYLAGDNRRNLYVHGHYNRVVMFTDVILTFNTFSEQMNCVSFIHNIVGVNHNRSIMSPLELYIPAEFCSLISNLVDIPTKSENGSTYDFLTYMNSVWTHPITYKLKGGSNTDEFFMYYMADIDTVVNDVNYDQGIKDGQIKRAFSVTFTLRCEFNTVGYLTLNSPEIRNNTRIPTNDEFKVLPIFSDSIDLNDFALPLGWSVLSWPIFKLKAGENSVSLAPILNQSLETVIDYHLRNGMPMSRFINIQFRENGNILTDEAFYINWVNRELIVTNPNVRRTYRLIITVSVNYINNLIKDLYNLE